MTIMNALELFEVQRWWDMKQMLRASTNDMAYSLLRTQNPKLESKDSKHLPLSKKKKKITIS